MHTRNFLFTVCSATVVCQLSVVLIRCLPHVQLYVPELWLYICSTNTTAKCRTDYIYNKILLLGRFCKRHSKCPVYWRFVSVLYYAKVSMFHLQNRLYGSPKCHERFSEYWLVKFTQNTVLITYLHLLPYHSIPWAVYCLRQSSNLHLTKMSLLFAEECLSMNFQGYCNYQPVTSKRYFKLVSLKNFFVLLFSIFYILHIKQKLYVGYSVSFLRLGSYFHYVIYILVHFE